MWGKGVGRDLDGCATPMTTSRVGWLGAQKPEVGVLRSRSWWWCTGLEDISGAGSSSRLSSSEVAAVVGKAGDAKVTKGKHVSCEALCRLHSALCTLGQIRPESGTGTRSCRQSAPLVSGLSIVESESRERQSSWSMAGGLRGPRQY